MEGYDVVALGIALMDILAAPVDRALFERDKTSVECILLAPGGDAANQAADLARLGRRVSLCCRLGDDLLGRQFAAEMEAYGVNLTHAAVSAESVTSVAIALVSADGQRSILHRRGNNYDFCMDDVDMNVIATARVLSVGSLYGCPKLEEDGLEAILEHAKRHGLMTFADMASDKKGQKLAGLRPFLPYIDWFLPSETESAYLTDGLGCAEAAQVFLDAGARNVVIKLGARGVYAHCRDFIGYVSAFQIDARDTTGSGDAFCAGLIHSLLEGKSTPEALDYACACGAFNALFLGAATAPFSQAGIDEFIRGRRRIADY